MKGLKPPMSARLRIVKESDAAVRSTSSGRAEEQDHDQDNSLFTMEARPSGFLSRRRLNAIELPPATPPLGAPIATLVPSAAAAPAVVASDNEAVTDPHDTLSWTTLPGDLDTRIVEAIRVAPNDGRSANVVFREKELQLGLMFAALTIPDAQALHRRLTIPAKDDPVASAFGLLTKERRDRLVRFLGDARRRAAKERSRR